MTTIEKNIVILVWIICLLIFWVFWGTVGFVLYHFISKFW